MLAQRDTEAVDLAAEIGRLMEPTAQRTRWAEIARDIDAFRFPDAAAALAKLSAELAARP